MANFRISPFKTAEFEKEEDRAILALHFSLLYLYVICIILGRQWECVLPLDVSQKVQSVLEDLRKVSSVTDRGVWTVGKKI
jgi:hypothetical protein